MNPISDLKWLIFILVILWFAWFLTGGPKHTERLKGPFLKPPAPMDTGDIYKTPQTKFNR